MTNSYRTQSLGRQTSIRENRLLSLQMGAVLILLELSFTGVLLCRGENTDQRKGLTPRIVGGSVAGATEYPWMTAIVHSEDPVVYRGLVSGGILIHPQWILTAAHSVEGKEAADIQAIAGIKNLISDTDITRHSIVKIVRHPRYGISESKLGSDLALLRLADRVENIPTLPLSNTLGDSRPGSMTRTMGWGRTTDRGFRAISLRTVDIPVVARESIDAIQIYGEELPLDSVLAGDLHGGKDTCEGDSGGPLLKWDGLRGDWRLLAVITGGSDLGCAVEGAPGLYTSIESHIAWIESIIVERFEDWVTIHGLNEQEWDSDEDGFSNWDEYARMTLPLNSDSIPRLIYGLTAVDGESFPTLGGLARVKGEDLEFWVDVSSDLTSWQGIARLSEQDASVISTNKTVFRWRNSLPLGDMETQFFRLSATRRPATRALPMKLNSSSLMLANQ